MAAEDLIMQRLEDQIQWYDAHSIKDQNKFKALKTIVIVAAALIPFLSGLSLKQEWFGIDLTHWIVGGLGVLITVIEGVQQLYQYQANWVAYRSTCEALRHEKFLFLGAAGPYAAAADPHALLAERIESLVSQEHAKWASSQQDKDRKEQREGC
jgi:Protein of unknown function (DUF4231)